METKETNQFQASYLFEQVSLFLRESQVFIFNLQTAKRRNSKKENKSNYFRKQLKTLILDAGLHIVIDLKTKAKNFL